MSTENKPKSAGLIPLADLLNANSQSDLFGVPRVESSEDAAATLLKEVQEKSSLTEKDKENENPDGDLGKEKAKDKPLPEKEGEKQKDLDIEDFKPGKPNDSYFRNILKDKFGIQAISQEVNGEEVQVPIDEALIDEEAFAQLIADHVQQEKEEATKDKISLNDVSDFGKKFLEVDRIGGDSRGLLELKNQFLDPFAGLDIEKVEDQKRALEILLKAQGETPEDIVERIEFYEHKGILEDKALAAEAQVAGIIDAAVELQKQKARDYAEDQKQKLKVYSDKLREEVKSKFELTDISQTKLVNFMTKTDQKGRTSFDDQLLKLRSNPKDAADLALFILDKEEYNKQITNGTLKEKAVQSSHKLKTIRTSKDVTSLDLKEKKEEQKLVPLDKLGN